MNCFARPFLLVRSCFILSLLLTVSISAISQTATLTSDAPDYPPGSTATLTGSGFQPGETVVVQVLHENYQPGDPIGEDHEPWQITADASGNFVTTWHVCEDDCVGATLRATADGQSSGLHAAVIFTDGNVSTITVGPPSGSLTYGSGGTITYAVTVTTLGNTAITLSTGGLPGTFNVGWSTTNPVNINGSKNITLTITVPNNTKIPVSPTFTFTVKATDNNTTVQATSLNIID